MDIPDYESDQEKIPVSKGSRQTEFTMNLTGWNEMFLKADLRRAIRQCGFEYPSQVQLKAIPYILQGQHVLCQAKSGMGKTAVFVISVLNLLVPEKNDYQRHSCFVLAPTRELAHQIHKDFKRLSRYFLSPQLRIGCYFGGIPIIENITQLKNKDTSPHIIISTPGRMMDLIRKKLIQSQNCRFFILDECDKMLSCPTMKKDVQKIFTTTRHEKQVLMFSATFTDSIKGDCKKFLQDEVQIYVDKGQLILHGLTQFYCFIPEANKFYRLVHLLDTLVFNQTIIFVNRIDRAKKLTELLKQKLFNPICVHSGLRQEERIKNYDLFKGNGSRLLVATDLFGRGIDIERVNLVINYDFPYDRDTYLHRVGRAGRFGTKGLAINFVKPQGQLNQKRQNDEKVLEEVQQGFQVKIQKLPKELDTTLFI